MDFYIFLGFLKVFCCKNIKIGVYFKFGAIILKVVQLFKESVTIIFYKSGDISKVMLLFPELCKFFLSVAMIVRVVLLFMSIAIILKVLQLFKCSNQLFLEWCNHFKSFAIIIKM